MPEDPFAHWNEALGLTPVSAPPAAMRTVGTPYTAPPRPDQLDDVFGTWDATLESLRPPSFGERAAELGGQALHGIETVVGAPKRATDWLMRESAKRFFGMGMPDDATTGNRLRAAAGLSVDPRDAQPENADSYVRRGLGTLLEFGGNLLDPTLALTGPAKAAATGGQLAERTLLRAGLEAAPEVATALERAVQVGKVAGTAEKALQASFATLMSTGAVHEAAALYESLKREGKLTPEIAEQALNLGLTSWMARQVGRDFLKAESGDPFAAFNRIEERPEAQRTAPPRLDLEAEREFLRPDPLALANADLARTLRGERALGDLEGAGVSDLVSRMAQSPEEAGAPRLSATQGFRDEGLVRMGPEAAAAAGLRLEPGQVAPPARVPVPPPPRPAELDFGAPAPPRAAQVGGDATLKAADDALQALQPQLESGARVQDAGLHYATLEGAALRSTDQVVGRQGAKREASLVIDMNLPSLRGTPPERVRNAIERDGDDPVYQRALADMADRVQEAGVAREPAPAAGDVPLAAPAPAVDEVPFDVPELTPRAGERRQAVQQVTREQRLSQRREVLAAEMGLPPDSMAVDRLARAELEARTDVLTGLGNGRAWQELQATVDRGRDQVVVLDGKKFKAINDTYGHEQGDRVLKTIAEAVARHLGDESARYGGDEFGGVVRGVSLEEARARAEAIREELAGTRVRLRGPNGEEVDLPAVEVHIGVGTDAEAAGQAVNEYAAPSRAGGRGDVALGAERADVGRPEPGAAAGAGAGLQDRVLPQPQAQLASDGLRLKPERLASMPDAELREREAFYTERGDQAARDAVLAELERRASPSEAPAQVGEAPDFEAWARRRGVDVTDENRPEAVRRWLEEHPDATADQRAQALPRPRAEASDVDPLAEPAVEEIAPAPDSPAPPEPRVASEMPAPGAPLIPATFREYVESRGRAWPVRTSDADYGSLQEGFKRLKALDAAAPAPVDVAATLAKQPTEAQAEVGNYQKGHARIAGLDISIENAAGSKRRPEWPTLQSHYGYIRGTVGKDKDHVDVFVRPGTPPDYNGPVFVVNQDRPGEPGAFPPRPPVFDEHKVMLGWDNVHEAQRAYLENYSRGQEQMVRGVAEFPSPAEFRNWLEQGDTKAPAPAVDLRGLEDQLRVKAEADKGRERGKRIRQAKADDAELQRIKPKLAGYSDKALAEREGHYQQKGMILSEQAVRAERERRAAPAAESVPARGFEAPEASEASRARDLGMSIEEYRRAGGQKPVAEVAHVEPERSPEPQPAERPAGDDAGALEGAPAERIPRAAKPRKPRPDAEAGRGADAGGVPRPLEAGDPVEPSVGDGAGGVGAAAAGEQPPAAVAPPKHEQRASRGIDYRIKPEDDLGAGGPVAKARGNIAAIRLLRKLEQEQRLATPEEQAELVKYVGWGQLPNVFEPWRAGYSDAKAYREAYDALQEMLTPEEFAAAKRSTTNAHYTSKPVVDAVWQAVERLGFSRGGSMLEPAVGIGHFLGLQPKSLLPAKRTAVELDPISARLTRQLYQNATVLNKPFQETTLPRGFYDLVVSNVPFADVKVHDPAFKSTPAVTGAIHDYYFAKALDLVRPGGLVAFITSRYTMDKQDAAVRRYLAERADLLGAVRLPNTAFKKNAGTEVVTDVIFLRRRAPGEQPAGEAWQKLEAVTGLEGAKHNEYFARHPEMVLGKPSLEGSMYGPAKEYTVEGVATPEALAAAVGRLPEGAIKAFSERVDDVEPQKVQAPTGSRLREGSYVLHEGALRVKRGEFLEAPTLAPAAAARAQALVPVRDALHRYFDVQIEDRPEAEIKAARKALNDTYDRFVKKHGAINEPANAKAFMEDPALPTLSALESYNAKTKKATKAPIFERRTIQGYTPPERVETAGEALTVALAEHGRLDWGRMEALTGRKRAQLEGELGDLAYRDPDGGAWAVRDDYLSGDVRKKLKLAEAAAAQDPAYERNVEALRAVQPVDLGPGDISVRLGTPWLPPEDVAQFAAELLEAGSRAEDVRVWRNVEAGSWAVEDRAGLRRLGVARDRWGTKDKHAIELIDDALNQRAATVWREDSQGKRFVDNEATTAARAKQDAIQEAFKEWIWRDQERAARLVQSYNENWNNLRSRRYDGSHLKFPGMARVALRSGDLEPHQKDFAWRMVQTAPGGGLLANHAVGGGKTFQAVAGLMEMRRMGIARKPFIAVPNHLVAQWSDEFRRLYPQANILVAGKETWGTGARQKTMAKIATGDWDAVIVPHSATTKLPLKAETQGAFLAEQVAELEAAIRAEEAQSEGSGDRKRNKTVKQLEKAKERLEVKIKDLLEKAHQDTGTHFEDLGVDVLMADEAQAYKNLFTPSRLQVAGIARGGSARAMDMWMKARWTAQRGGRVTFLTATPVSNTLGEAYVIQKFLQPDLLRERGLQHFDSWAGQFGVVVPSAEQDVSGRYRVAQRFAAFSNVPELATMLQAVMDTRLPEDLNLPKPKAVGGKPIIHVAPGSPELKAYITLLQERADKVKARQVEPTEDNMLKITSDGRKAALDLRLVAPWVGDSQAGKIHEAVRTIAGIHKRTTDKRSTQLVFLDLSTPKEGEAEVSTKKRKPGVDIEEEVEQEQGAEVELAEEAAARGSVYDEMRRLLIAAGVPAEDIAFIHAAKTDAQRRELFSDMNSGKVRVLFASSEKGGAGMNAQRKMIALHHMDTPWRPDQLEQRNGRMFRQGNENAEVEEHRYVTGGSFDSFSWQTIERKGRFVHDFMTAKPEARTIEDIGAVVLDAAQMKAAASGDPLLLERVVTENELGKLEVLERAHRGAARDREYKIGLVERELPAERAAAAAYEADAKAMTKPAGPWALKFNGQEFDSRKDAGGAVLDLLRKDSRKSTGAVHVELPGEYGGQKVVFVSRGTGYTEGYVIGPSGRHYEFGVGSDPVGVMRAMENAFEDAPARYASSARARIAAGERDLAAWRAEQGKPFERMKDLETKRVRLQEITKQLEATAAPVEEGARRVEDPLVAEMRRRLGGTQHAAAAEGGAGAPVTLEGVRRAFKGAEWSQQPDGSFEASIGGARVRIQPDATIVLDEASERALEVSRQAAGARPGTGSAGTTTYTAGITPTVLVQLAKGVGGDPRIINHEAFHVAMRLALSEAERKAVLRRYGFEDRGHASSEARAEALQLAEERAAHAYGEWSPAKRPEGLFGRIMGFFRRVYRSFFPDAETVFERVAGGEAFARERGGDLQQQTNFADERPPWAKPGAPYTDAEFERAAQAEMSPAARERWRRENPNQAERQDFEAHTAELRARGVPTHPFGKVFHAAQPVPRPGPVAARDKPMERAAEAAADDDAAALHGKPGEFPINLERIGVDEDVKQSLARVVKSLGARMEKAKGYESQADTHRLALESGITPTELIALQKQHGALTARYIEAGRLLREEAAKDVRRQLEAHRAAPDDLEAERSYLASVTRLGAIAAETVAAGAEAGRALAAHKMMSEGLQPGERFFKKILRAHPAVKPAVRDRLLRAIIEGNQREIMAAAREAIKPRAMDKFLEFWKAGLVSGPPTIFGNILSNASFEALRIAEHGVAGLVDGVVSKIRGTEQERFASEAVAATTGLLSSVPQALKLVWNGHLEEQLKVGSKYEGRPGAIGGQTGRIVRLPFRALQAWDDGAKHMAAQGEIVRVATRMAAAAHRNGTLKGSADALVADLVERTARYTEAKLAREAGLELDDVGQKALTDREAGRLWAAADKAAHEATFQDETGKFTQLAMAARGEAKLLGIPLGHLVIPFLNVPSRILAQAVKRSPLGFIEAWRALKGLKEGTVTQGEFSEALAKPLMGTMLAIGFYAAAKAGNITGSGPSDDRKRKLLEETGWKPYSIKMGKQYIQFKRLEPLATMLGLAADMAEAGNEHDAATVAEKLQASIVQNITEKSWLTGVTSLAEAWQDPKRYGPKWLKGLEASLVPNVVRKAAVALDPIQRDTSGLVAPILAGIPGLSETLPARKQGTGEVIERQGTALERFASPFPRSEEREGREFEQELLELDYAPSPPSRTLQIPGSKIKVELTPREFQLLQDADKATTDRLRKLIKSAAFRRLDGESKRDMVMKAYEQGRRQARQVLYYTPSFEKRVAAARREARATA